MFCFKCGRRLPARVVNCPDCDTPQKRRQRYRRRMILGLFIFLAGAVAGSFFDTIIFQGEAWNYSFLGYFDTRNSSIIPGTGAVASSSEIIKDTENPAASAAQKLYAPEKGEVVTMMEAAPESVLASEGIVNSENSITGAPANLEIAIASSTALSVPSAIVDEKSLVASFAVFVPPTEKIVAEGRLTYLSCEPIEKDSSSNYHGFLARDGSELLFASNRYKKDGKPLYQCFTKALTKGAVAERVFEWPGNVWTPESTPDSAKIVFSSDSSKPEHIFVYDRISKKTKAVTSGKSKNMMPAISPDGSLVTFVSNRKGSNHIWLMEMDGENLLQLTTGEEDDREPRWSADGKTLLFTRIYQQLKKSFIMQIRLHPLGEPLPLVDTNKRNWLADMSPDDSMLAYIRSESDDGSKNTLVLREMVNGKERILKPLGDAEYYRPVWSADCLSIVFHATVAGSRNLYLARFVREKTN